MKKLLALMLATLLVLTCFVGCAAETKNDTPSTEQSSQDSSDAPADNNEASNASTEITGKITYVSWMTKGEDEQIIQNFMKEYPGVEVEIRAIDGTNYGSDVLTLCAGGDVPDVLLTKPMYLADLVDQGYIAPIDDFKGVETQTGETVNEVCSRNGNLYLYAINGAKGTYYIYYNKAIFEEYGLSVPNSPEELDAICETLKNNGVTPLITPAGDTWNSMYFANGTYLSTVQSFGGPVATEIALLEGSIKPSDLYGPIMNRIAEYKENGYLSEGGLSMGWEAAAQYFCEGNAAMFSTGSWFPGSTPVAENPDFEYGCFTSPVTAVDGVYLDYLSIDRCIGVSAKTEYPEAARALVEYFIREDVLKEYLTSQGLIGVNVVVPASPVLDDVIAKLSGDDYVLSPKTGLSDMPTGWNSNYNQYCADACAGSSPAELLQKLDDEYASFIAGIDVQPIIDSLK